MMLLNALRKPFNNKSKEKVSPNCLAKIQIVSDLHLEVSDGYSTFTIPKKAKYLLLAGDIGRFSSYDSYLTFIRQQCYKFERVFLVLGNHEFYGLFRVEGMRRVSQMMKERSLEGRLTVLDRTRIDLPENFTILGCTLHSHIPDEARAIVQEKVQDFRMIDGWTIDDHNEAHELDKAWLKDQIKSINKKWPNRQIVVATHHAPSHHQTSEPKLSASPWRSAFSTPLVETQMADWPGLRNVQYWVFGHTHWCAEFEAYGVSFVANQRGYFDAVSAERIHAWSRKTSSNTSTNPMMPALAFDPAKCITVH